MDEDGWYGGPLIDEIGLDEMDGKKAEVGCGLSGWMRDAMQVASTTEEGMQSLA
eukprot:CAMPEP_0175940424 /NCGR_PEP_ID=MMETSP0108-20121206/23796_1 /TAXON_ID=195067 ORGANISM="Goniomonas pacifica, Strain CCMP1869" /NCGR_SAMPLE_ID=MMETSP0108 /ASSEMBLY_ACC=CAM_ASM_000204 /LENGTH=53 /DNA_ID=CAMNT_0017264889 /DNA_START=95 /DNA_END=252 /DNA_ORIENTATION=+